MKFLLALGIMVLASGACEAATPALSESDFDVVSVVPRSGDVKPFVMSLPAKDRRNTQHHDKVASLQTGAVDANR
jgi:hypothetical protein